MDWIMEFRLVHNRSPEVIGTGVWNTCGGQLSIGEGQGQDTSAIGNLGKKSKLAFSEYDIGYFYT